MAEPEFIEPRPGARRRGVLLVLLMAALGGAAILTIPVMVHLLREAPACNQRTWVHVLFSVQALLLLVGPALLASMGVRALRAGAWPAPGARVLRRTRVWRGARMRMLAWLSIASRWPQRSSGSPFGSPR